MMILFWILVGLFIGVAIDLWALKHINRICEERDLEPREILAEWARRWRR